MNFDDIPKWIYEWEVLENTGKGVCDSDLKEIEIKEISNNTSSWKEYTPRTILISSDCSIDDNTFKYSDGQLQPAIIDVKFKCNEWTREGNGFQFYDHVQFWQLIPDEINDQTDYNDNNFIYARKSGSYFVIVSCLMGHSGVATPEYNWTNSYGNTSVPFITFENVDDLINKVESIGKSFVKNQ